VNKGDVSRAWQRNGNDKPSTWQETPRGEMWKLNSKVLQMAADSGVDGKALGEPALKSIVSAEYYIVVCCDCIKMTLTHSLLQHCSHDRWTARKAVRPRGLAMPSMITSIQNDSQNFQINVTSLLSLSLVYLLLFWELSVTCFAHNIRFAHHDFFVMCSGLVGSNYSCSSNTLNLGGSFHVYQQYT